MGLIGLIAIALPYFHYTLSAEGVEGEGTIVLSLYTLFQSTTNGVILGMTAFLFIASVLSFITPYGSLLGTIGFIVCPLIMSLLGDIAYSVAAVEYTGISMECTGSLLSMSGFMVIGILFAVPYVLMAFAEEYKEGSDEWRKMDGFLYLFTPSDKF